MSDWQIYKKEKWQNTTFLNKLFQDNQDREPNRPKFSKKFFFEEINPPLLNGHIEVFESFKLSAQVKTVLVALLFTLLT